jgi:hypothetical protein
MLLERIRIAGISMIVAAISVTGWKSFAGARVEASFDEEARAAGPSSPISRSVLTIPVEIVESGEAPRLHEVRVTR